MTNTEIEYRTQAVIEAMDTEEVTMAAEDNLKEHFEAYDEPMERLRQLCPQLYHSISAASESLRLVWGEQCATNACQIIFKEVLDTRE